MALENHNMQSRRNPRLARKLRTMGLGKVVDSTRVRSLLGIPINRPEKYQSGSSMRIGMIGINIYAKFLNFACDLHALAFQEFLKSEGHEVSILDYKPVHFGDFNMKYPQEYSRQRYNAALSKVAATSEEESAKKALIAKWKVLAEGYESVIEERAIRYEKFQSFAAQHLQLTKEKYNSDLLEVVDPGFDAYICVTDVIWQAVEKHSFDRGFLLGSKAFEGKPKIAYAASRGASPDYSEKDEENFLTYLSDIDSVSVREEDFEAYIESVSGRQVSTVVDPVMLHGVEFWNRYTDRPKERGFVLLYYVMEKSTDTIQKAIDYAKANGLLLVELSDRPLKNGLVSDPDVRHISRHDVGMEEWLGYIKYAEAVFTNSFHGCCFSVIFEKQLYAGQRNGSKVSNFLATFGLESQRFDAQTDISTLPRQIDYSLVRDKWEVEKSKAEKFIREALSAAQAHVNESLVIDHSSYDEARRQITYKVRYHSQLKGDAVQVREDVMERGYVAKQLESGALEGYFTDEAIRNNGTASIPENPYVAHGKNFVGWNLRFRIDNHWFWMSEDQKIRPATSFRGASIFEKKMLSPGDFMPHLSVNQISIAVLEAQWR